MRCIFFILLAVFASCNQSAETKEDKTPTPGAAATTVQPEDSLTAQLRTAVTSLEKQDLQMASTIRSMSIDSIHHEMISLKQFYAINKEELAKEMRFSTNKEKTTKALAYLDKMIARSSAAPDLYKVQFHMNAALSNTTVYNEQHTKFLKKDLSEMTIVFP